MKTYKDITYFEDKKLDFFIPDSNEFKTIIHFHGGGIEEGDKYDTHTLCEHLCSKGYAVVTVNYSLYPNTKFPDYLYEAANAVKYVLENIGKYGTSTGFFISGQSAGAWISLMLCFNNEYFSSVGVDKNLITGWISDAAQTTSHFNIMKIEKHVNPWIQRIDETAPLYYVDENVNFSHILLLYYKEDLPSRVEQNRLLISTIKNFNKELDITGMLLEQWHCHSSCALDDDGEFEFVKIVDKWIKELK